MMRNFLLPVLMLYGSSLIAQSGKEERSFRDSNGLYGWKNRSGKVLVPGTYHLPLTHYGDGIVYIADENYQRGLMDTNGVVIVPPKYGAIGSFQEGLALVINKNEKSFYITRSGKEIHFDLDYDKSYAVSEGLIQVVKNNRWGFMDTNGKLVIPFQFDEARAFNNGYAGVAKGNTLTASGRKTALWGYIDTTGKQIIGTTYTAVSSVTGEGLFAVSLSDPFSKDVRNITWGYVDTSGKLVIPYKFNHAYAFSDGIALVCINKSNSNPGEWGFITKTQAFIFPPIPCTVIYGNGKDFKEKGFVVVKRTHNESHPDNSYSINRQGKRVAIFPEQ